jgi:hypothetical protein
MVGFIRVLVGLIVVFGAVGGMDTSPDSDLLMLVGIAVAGLLVMASGVFAMKGDV